jgi:hypothetical protein
MPNYLVNDSARVTLANVRTGESIEAQFNPTALEESLAVNYAKQVVPGLSHEVLQFTNVGNHSFRLQLYFRAMDRYDAERLLYVRRFLYSLCYPSAGAEDVAGGGPPRVLVIWPNALSLVCVVTNLAFNHQQFSANGMSRVYSCDVSLEEISDCRITSEEVRTTVKRYGPDAPPELDDESDRSSL